MMAVKETKTKKVEGLRITTRQDGFWRGGRAWHGTTEVLKAEFDQDRLAAILREPRLVVEEILIEVADDTPATGSK